MAILRISIGLPEELAIRFVRAVRPDKRSRLIATLIQAEFERRDAELEAASSGVDPEFDEVADDAWLEEMAKASGIPNPNAPPSVLDIPSLNRVPKPSLVTYPVRLRKEQVEVLNRLKDERGAIPAELIRDSIDLMLRRIEEGVTH